MLKIKDAAGKVIAKLEDEDSAPVMIKKIDPTEDVLNGKRKPKKEEEDDGQATDVG